jgi:DNA-binding MarR family transcriptional regulator
MSDPIDEIVSLDKVIHEPARLALMTALTSCRSADFVFLQRLTGLTQGNLSVHLTKLEAAGFVQIDKSFEGRRPKTSVAATAAGRAAITAHWDRLETLRDRAEKTLGGSGMRPGRKARS